MSRNLTVAQTALVKTEFTNDPYGLGYAPFIPIADFGNLASLLTFLRDGVTPCPINAVIGRSGTITGATNATPVVIASTAHGLSTSDSVVISGVGGNLAANGTFVITKVNNNSFSLNGSTGNGAYTSGGTFHWLVTGVRQQNITTQQMLGAIDNRDLITQGGSAAVTADQQGKLLMLQLIVSDGQVSLVNDDGTDNQNLHSIKQALNDTNGSQTRITALSKRIGSRLENLLGLSGIVPTEDDMRAALV